MSIYRRSLTGVVVITGGLLESGRSAVHVCLRRHAVRWQRLPPTASTDHRRQLHGTTETFRYVPSPSTSTCTVTQAGHAALNQLLFTWFYLKLGFYFSSYDHLIYVQVFDLCVNPAIQVVCGIILRYHLIVVVMTFTICIKLL